MRVVICRVRRQTGECAAVVTGARTGGVKDLAETMGTAVIFTRLAPRGQDSPTGKTKDRKRHEQNRDRSHLDIIGLNLFAKILRRTAHHQTGNKDCQHDKYNHSVETGTDPAKDNFSHLDVE